MRNLILVSLAAVTVLGALASPSNAQQASRSDGRGSGGGEYYAGASRIETLPITQVNVKRRLVRNKGGAYCSTNWHVLFDERGRRTDVRHCDDRRHIDIE